MFDIGFFEICLIGIIALVAIGPEKLPRVARTIGLWIGRAQGMVKTVKYEIDEQIRIEELKQSAQKQSQSINEEINQTIDSSQQIINDIKQDSRKQSKD